MVIIMKTLKTVGLVILRILISGLILFYFIAGFNF